jgi:cytochrome c oxidase cbb3-type subunit 3
MARTKDHLSDHEYDGIREFDNPTPGWWHLIFGVTVVFSFFYFVYYEGNPDARTVWTELARRQAVENKKIFGALGDLQPDAPTMLSLMKDGRMMAIAQGQFQTTCAQCHAKDGGGINGVNLCDDSYKNVKKLEDMFAVITEGAGNGAMPSWRTSLSQNERVLM